MPSETDEKNILFVISLHTWWSLVICSMEASSSAFLKLLFVNNVKAPVDNMMSLMTGALSVMKIKKGKKIKKG